MVVYLVRDLFFVAKIRDAATQLGIETRAAADAAALHDAARSARLAIVDLRLPDALTALARLRDDPATAAVPSVGFIDHEDVDAMAAARAGGCGQVMSKRKFSADLPALLAAGRG